MPTFAITFLDRHGRRHAAVREGADLPQVRAALRSEHCWPVAIRTVAAPRPRARLRVPVRDFVPLLQQLELQLRAGVTADVALAQLAEDLPAGPLREMLGAIHREVAQGRPIHEACRYFARQFPPHLAAVIAAGEASAQLPEALRALASHLAGIDDIRRTARRAFIYPGIVLAATTGLVGFLLGGVVPQFADVFASLHLALPAITRGLIAASGFVRNDWPGLTGGIVFAMVLAWLVARSRRLRYGRDWLLLRVPVAGDTVRHLATARFAAHCRLLHEAGIPLLEALATGAELTGNAVLARELLQAREKVAVGQPLYAALPKPHSFPGFMIPALKSGETTGQLGEALRHIEEYAAIRAKERLGTSLALLEPLLLGGLTAVVGLIALSFFLPLFSLLSGLQAR
jgi:type II secretory pathway component PulF